MTLPECESCLQSRSIFSTSPSLQTLGCSVARHWSAAETARDWISQGSWPRGGHLGLLEATAGLVARRTLRLNNAECSSWSWRKETLMVLELAQSPSHERGLSPVSFVGDTQVPCEDGEHVGVHVPAVHP